jgi:deoxyribodipyrimidine photo-lyase
MRRDLRLSDNPIFHEVSRQLKQHQTSYTHLLPLYVFPAQQMEVSGFLNSPDARSPYREARSPAGGFWRCGSHRVRFLAESVWDVKRSLEGVGSGLELRAGTLGDVVRELLAGYRDTEAQVVGVWMTSEEGVEERREEKEVRQATEDNGINFKIWVDEKYYIDEWVLSRTPGVQTLD